MEYEKDFSTLIITLMKGVLYREKQTKLWNELLLREAAVRDYLQVMNLELVVFVDDGFAYLKNRVADEEEETGPHLISRRPLSYPVSLTLAMLRRELMEHDARQGEERVVVDREEMRMQIMAFLPTATNEALLVRRIEAAFKQAEELGFIEGIGEKQEKIEIKRIIGAYIDAQWLREFDERLKAYSEYGTIQFSGEE